MELDLTNGQRPSAALQKAMGNGAPLLDDSQCLVFEGLINENGGVPHGWPKAQNAFRERYSVVNGRWVENKKQGAT